MVEIGINLGILRLNICIPRTNICVFYLYILGSLFLRNAPEIKIVQLKNHHVLVHVCTFN